MLSNSDNLRPPAAQFQSELANVLFDAPPPAERAAREAQITKKLLESIESMSSAKLFRMAAYIDAVFVDVLSGSNRLAVAKAIERKSPAALPLMPNLGRDLQRLKQAAHLARILRPEALRRLTNSIAFWKVTNGEQ